jgi:hypothetical protein
MADEAFTLIDNGRICETRATIDGKRVSLTPAAVHATLGWELKPQGLCNGDRCVPVRGYAELVTDTGIDLARLAAALSRPLAIDVDERVACLGASAVERSAQLASLDAPDFILPDLSGRMHALSDFRGKKVLLVAYASW